jgi:cellulose synthase/poly-beta-1,6-N-acetylglucosamine synthase-like glycosyltransferase
VLLPTPPDDEQKYLYLRQDKWLFYALCVLCTIFLFSGMILFSWTSPYLATYTIFIALLFVYLSISYAVGVKGKPFDFEKHKECLQAFPGKDSTVDVFLPVCGEPLEILKNTWTYVSKLAWEKKTVYVLDDGRLDSVKKLAEEFGFKYLRRNNTPHLKKAGNIRDAFQKTQGDFILILDADFAPRSDMLDEMVPYFLSDKSIAIVQSPQFFEVDPRQNWIEQGAGSVQELFYRMIQVNRNTWGASICVGSCALYRRAALEPMGGTYPIEHSEDLHTGFSMIQAGHKVTYLPINLSKGVCPDSSSSFFIQQYRWCTGSTSLMTTRRFWETPLPLLARCSFLSGMLYYPATSAALFLSVIPSMVMVWFIPDKLIWFAMFFYTPSFLFGVVFMRFWNKNRYTLDVLRVRQLSYWAYLFALKDKFLKSTVPWVPTGTKTNVERFRQFRKLMFYWVSISTFIVLSGIFYNIGKYEIYNFLPTLFFTSFNYWISMHLLREQE